MKKEKGITLIALIVSIIVMLILVVVTINIVFEGGLIDKAQQAKDDTELAAQNDNNMIEEAGGEIDKAAFGYYLNPNPPVITEENAFGTIFDNGALILAAEESAEAGFADQTAIPIILIVDDSEATQQTVYTYFYNDYSGAEMKINVGMEVSMGQLNITKGWYKSINKINEDLGTVTTKSFDKITNVSNIKILIGETYENFYYDLPLTNMNNFISKTPYTN